MLYNRQAFPHRNIAPVKGEPFSWNCDVYTLLHTKNNSTVLNATGLFERLQSKQKRDETTADPDRALRASTAVWHGLLVAAQFKYLRKLFGSFRTFLQRMFVGAARSQMFPQPLLPKRSGSSAAFHSTTFAAPQDRSELLGEELTAGF